ncbi:MAG: NFACT RNA binding domain-containing protein [Bacillota bacterium]|nr:NFACT RNA binding domain-containing protein [Bacillota bacterium]
MPFDGVVVKCVVNELSDILTGSRVEKIFQPESDEIIINIRAKGQNYKLLLSASANYPRIHFTDSSKENPAIPPVFCMLLRKHLSGGRITGIEFHDFERIITINIESVNELGDLTNKNLIIEIMGRHSNIILTNSDGRILDSIKHVDNEVSRVREVMPGRQYIMPPAQDKYNPETLDLESFINEASCECQTSAEKYLLNKIKGFSPLLCREISFLSGVDDRTSFINIPQGKKESFKNALEYTIKAIASNNFKPCIIFESDDFYRPIDFHCLNIEQYKYVKHYELMNNTLDEFYKEKDSVERSKQKKSDVLKILNNNLDRCHKKLSLQQEKLREVSDRDKLKLFGELITANIYSIPKSAKSVSLLNYYSDDNDYIDIKLDPDFTPQQNAQRYFKQYSKSKSAFFSTTKQLEETSKEIEYLEGVLQLLDNCSSLQEINEVRQELSNEGYLSKRKNNNSNKKEKPSAPLHFRSSDGFDIFVGKNNKQNDLLTLKQSTSFDIWLHTKNIPGSHVIIKNSQKAVPDNTLLEASIIAAYHSKAKSSANVPIDYTAVKNVKKLPGAKPGMVNYENYKTIIVTPDEKLVKKLLVE